MEPSSMLSNHAQHICWPTGLQILRLEGNASYKATHDRIKLHWAWLMLGWVTSKRSFLFNQTACLAVVRLRFVL
ncbi:hypothetical protein J6590_104094 [Homalodisca vitripennis]|nr:hypothetical protein J6590_104094 [Homalodisca vitripennis]